MGTLKLFFVKTIFLSVSALQYSFISQKISRYGAEEGLVRE